MYRNTTKNVTVFTPATDGQMTRINAPRHRTPHTIHSTLRTRVVFSIFPTTLRLTSIYHIIVVVELHIDIYLIFASPREKHATVKERCYSLTVAPPPPFKISKPALIIYVAIK